jgi:hypothetical protein
VREVNGNDKMLSYINGNKYSIGYVAAESVDYESVASDETPSVNSNISNTKVIDFIDASGNVQTPSKDNIETQNYGVENPGDENSLIRGFNQF